MHKSTSVITKISAMREVCTGTNYLSHTSMHTRGRRPTPSDVTEFLYALKGVVNNSKIK